MLPNIITLPKQSAMQNTDQDHNQDRARHRQRTDLGHYFQI